MWLAKNLTEFLKFFFFLTEFEFFLTELIFLFTKLAKFFAHIFFKIDKKKLKSYFFKWILSWPRLKTMKNNENLLKIILKFKKKNFSHSKFSNFSFNMGNFSLNMGNFFLNMVRNGEIFHFFFWNRLNHHNLYFTTLKFSPHTAPPPYFY